MDTILRKDIAASYIHINTNFIKTEIKQYIGVYQFDFLVSFYLFLEYLNIHSRYKNYFLDTNSIFMNIRDVSILTGQNFRVIEIKRIIMN